MSKQWLNNLIFKIWIRDDVKMKRQKYLLLHPKKNTHDLSKKHYLKWTSTHCNTPYWRIWCIDRTYYSIGFQFLATRLIHYTIGYNMKLGINWVWSHPKLSHNNLPMQVCSWLPRTYNYVEWVQLISISQVFRVVCLLCMGWALMNFNSTHAIWFMTLILSSPNIVPHIEVQH
jgi:hypothetical protein